MPKSKAEEVQTTLRIDEPLHTWLKHYAVDHKTSLVGIMKEVLYAWAEEHGFQPPKASEDSSSQKKPSRKE